MEQAFWLYPRDKPALLLVMIRELSENSHILLEGNLSACDWSAVPGAVVGIVEPFRSQYGSDAVVLPISEQTTEMIKTCLLPGDIILRDVGAIQIEQAGQVQFMAADHFHHECVSVGSAIGESSLQQLVASGILRGYETHAAAMKRVQERLGVRLDLG